MNSSPYPVFDRRSMSVLVGTGNNRWSGLYVISSTLSFVILMYLLDIFYINRLGMSSWWYKGLLFVICMLASVFIFGGLVVGLWHLWERRNAAREACEDDSNSQGLMSAKSCQFNRYLLWFKTRLQRYGILNFCSITRLNFVDPLSFVLLQKFLGIYPRNGAALMLVSLCAVLQLFSPLLLKKSGHRISEDNAIIQSSISIAIVSICRHHLHYLPLNVVN